MDTTVINKKESLIKRIIYTLIVLAVIGLATVVFFYPIRNAVPPGADSSVYINDVRWILHNHRLPKPNELITHDYQAYPSPGTDIVVTLLVLLTGLPIIKVFAWFQLFLVTFLFLTTYLVGRLYNRRLALLFIIALVGSFSLFRLYISSTVSNLMAFSIINLIFYFSIVLSKAARKMKYVIILALLFVLLYLFHSYLSAPIFLAVFLIYLIILSFTQKDFRTQAKIFLKERSRVVLFGIGLLIIGTIIIGVSKYRSIGHQAMQAFLSPQVNDKFRYIVNWKQLGELLGQPIWDLAFLGILLFLSNWKKNIYTWRVFPFLWVVMLWVLMQSYHFGVHFYFERLVFLAGVSIAFFAAFTVDYSFRAKGFKPVLIFLLVSVMTISGVNYMVSLFQASNKVGDHQLAALKILAEHIKPSEIVLSNFNGVAQTRHDVIITDANIKYYPSVKRGCETSNLVCSSFTSPENNDAVKVLKDNFVSYILLLTPNYESNSSLDILAKKYLQNTNFKTLYRSNDAYLFLIAQ